VVGINLAGDGLRDLLDPRLARVTAPARAPAPAAPDGPPDDAPALLRVEGLTVRFPRAGAWLPVVEGLDLLLDPGERLGLVGESGSGKTVTARALLALVPAPGVVTRGRVRFRGEDLARAPAARLRSLRGRRIAYVPQDPMAALSPLFTVGEQLVETVRVHDDPGAGAARGRALELLGQVRLPEPERLFHAFPHQLSGGQRQRVLIALAVAHDPDLLIADEATTALDVTVQAEVLGLRDRLCADRGTALLFVSHDLAVVARLCSRVAVMYGGQVVEEAPAEVLLRRPRHPYTRALLACVPELGRSARPLTPIPGQPPSPGAHPPGCPFAPRCPHALAPCRAGPVTAQAPGPGHRVRCLRWQELGP
jgi:peptide/nickel transport system permease protein